MSVFDKNFEAVSRRLAMTSSRRGVLSRLAFRKFRVGSPIRMALVSCHDGNARQMSRT